jgi:MoxR-like ATPase
VEELTRIPADVQDTLITLLSEKTLPIPELGQEVQAVRGFNLIATANDRDRGINELSSALRRRFNTVVLPLPESVEAEVDIVARRVDQIGRSLDLPAAPEGIDENVRRIEEQVERLSLRIRRLIDYFGVTEPETEARAVSDVLGECLALYRPVAERKGVFIEAGRSSADALKIER